MFARRQDLYQVLGISRSASPGTVRRAYRQRALATHPDKGGSAEAFRRVVLAFEILGSLIERTKYDTRHGKQVEVSKPASCASSYMSPAAHTNDWQQQTPVSISSENNGPGDAKRRSTMPASQPPPKRKQVGPHECLLTALEKLRTLLVEVDRDLRMELLSGLCRPVKEELLTYMRHAPTPARSMLSLGMGEHGMQQTRFSRDSSSDEGCDATTDSEDARSEFSDEFENPSVLHIQDEHALDRVDTKKIAWDEHICRNSRSSEYATLAGEQESREFVVGTAGANKHVSNFRSLGKSGLCGISTWMDARYAGEPHQVYRAKITIPGIVVHSRTQSTLDAVISDHMALVHLRDALCAILGRHHSSLGHAPEQVLTEILKEERKIRSAYAAQDEFLFTYFAVVSAYSFIGRQLFTPHTRDILVCIQHLQTLKRAKCQSWETLRSAWAMVSMHVEPRIPGSRGNTNVEQIARLDAAYDRHAPVRKRRQQRKERLAKRIEEKAGRQHLLRIARTKRRFAHIAENRRKRIAFQLRQQWARQDLTMEDILRGPPDFGIHEKGLE